MVDFIRISTDDLTRVYGDLDALGPAGRNAYRRAVRKTTRYAERQIVSQLAKSSQVPQRAITGKSSRGAKRVVSSGTGRGDRGAGYVWVGYNPLPVSRIGAPKQTRRGTRVGKHSFPGSFVARMPSGFTSSFRRAPDARRRPAQNVWGITALPIIEDTVELVSAPEVVRNVQLLSQVRLRTLMQQELNYELNVKGYRPGRR